MSYNFFKEIILVYEKIIAGILSLLMLLCLVGCDKKDVSSSKYIGSWEASDLSLLGEKEAFR